MAFDGIVTKSVVKELNKNIIGCKVNKIYEPTPNDIILDLYGNGNKYNLHICTNRNFSRINLTKYSKPNPVNAPNFCMLLRKHLNSSKIIDISGFDLERIIEITFETYNEVNDKIIKKLIIEIMGQFSNVILVNENGTIHDSLKHVVTKTREVLPIRPYEFPSNTKKSFLKLNSFDEFIEIFDNSSDKKLDKFFSNNFIGISMPFIQNICNYFNIDINNPNQEQLKKIFLHIKDIIKNIDNLNINCFEGLKNDYYINISDNNSGISVNNFIDEYYYKIEQKDLFINYRDALLKNILSILTKYNKRLENIEKKIKECENMEQYKLYGELLTTNLYKIKDIPKEITVTNYYNNQEVTIPLDTTISPSKNVERYYKKYNKCKNALSVIQIQKKETLEDLEYIDGLIEYIKNCNDFEKLKKIGEEFYGDSDNSNEMKNNKKTNKSSPKKYIINGFTVYVGKNNKQNDLLTKSANKEDMWFHTQKIHGSHVILKTEGKKVDFDTILKCAKLAAQNSKAKNSSNVPVDYTFVKYVRKPSGSKPGLAIYTNYKTIFVN